MDVLYLDNTFLKKKFDFPPKHRALNLAIEHIQNLLDANQHTRIFIALDSIGKEEVVVAIARHFETYAVVDEQRYELLKAMDFDPELFTTNPSEGIVQVVRKNTLYRRLEEDPEATGLILSGWVNSPSYRFGKRIYVPLACLSVCPTVYTPISRRSTSSSGASVHT